MINLQTLKNSGFFTTGLLKVGEILFDEGDLDDFLYIVESGKLSVEKYIGDNKMNIKKLAILEAGSIFGEGSLSNSDPKEVKIAALENTQFLKINGKTDLVKFLQQYPKEGIELLSQIIESTNKRLLESDFLITSSYSIIKYISQIGEFNNKNLFSIIDKLLKVISADYIKYVEQNPIFGDILVLRYDTRNPGKMQDQVVESNDMSNLKELSFKNNNILVENLENGNKIIGYLIIGSKKAFNEGQKKSISMIAVSIAGFVKQKQNRELEK